MSKVNTIKEIAKKIADNNDANDYDHIPIGADSDNIDRPNGETVEEALSKMENKNIKQLKFTGASTATYDGTAEKTINIPSYTVFKGASASAAGNTGLVPAPVASTSRKYLRDDGTWGVPDTTSYTVMKGATVSVAGTSGLVPAPSAGNITRYLRADATWGTLGAAAFANIVDNRTTNVKGFVPDATQLTEMQAEIDSLNSALENIKLTDNGCILFILKVSRFCFYFLALSPSVPSGGRVKMGHLDGVTGDTPYFILGDPNGTHWVCNLTVEDEDVYFYNRSSIDYPGGWNKAEGILGIEWY